MMYRHYPESLTPRTSLRATTPAPGLPSVNDMKTLDRTGLALGVALAAIALTGAVWSAISDTTVLWGALDHRPSELVIVAVHAGAYLVAAAILVTHQKVLDVNPVARWTSRLAAANFCVLALMFTIVTVVMPEALTSPEAEPTGVVAAAFGISFALLFLLPSGLGFALLRHPPLRGPALLLASVPIILGITAILSSLTTWANPAYAETAIALGIPWLGLTADDQNTRTREPDHIDA